MPGPFAPPSGLFPALYLYPLNDSFVPKHIALPAGQRIKIGRQTNAKTVPGERNGFFDSKVLSRQHAEVWEDNGKIYIKDVKSSNGTFINGERLSPEGHESEPFELKTDDIVEFGIDIVGEDNKTVVHHKVAARVTCVFNEADAATASRSEASGSMGPMQGSGFNFGGPGNTNGPRRPGLQQQQQSGLGGMGGMGSLRPPGKSGLTFDIIISRLQGELQKSRETGAELHGLTGAMGEIHETLGGSLPQQMPPYPAQLPPVRPPQPASETGATAGSSGSDAGSAAASAGAAAALGELQEQLRETQSSLAGHADKVRALEGVLAEHDAIKREVANLRETLAVRPSTSSAKGPAPLAQMFDHHAPHEEEETSSFEAESDDDDVRSVGTAVPHELERVDEEDEEAARTASDEEEAHRAPRPRTPEPGSLGMNDEQHGPVYKNRGGRPNSGQFTDVLLSDRPSSPAPARISEELDQRLAALATQLESALELSRSLAQQHEQAQGTISALQEKVAVLEGRVQTTEATAQQTAADVEEIKAAPAPAAMAASESLTEMVNEWKKHVEGRWSDVQEEWTSERERLRRATEEWERRAGALETSVQSAVSRVDAGLERVDSLARLGAVVRTGNGEPRHHGLVTPPSPRSLSADSPRASRVRRRRGSRSSSRSRGSETSSSGADVHPALETSSDGSEGASAASSLATSFTDSPRRTKMPWPLQSGTGTDEEVDDVEPAAATAEARKGDAEPGQYPLTPKASFEDEATRMKAAAVVKAIRPAPDTQLASYSSALGVVVLSVAAAAVMYRVKPDFAT